MQAIAEFPYKHIYPDPGRCCCVRRWKVCRRRQSHLLCGTGSDELLDLLLRLFVEPGDAVIIVANFWDVLVSGRDLWGRALSMSRARRISPWTSRPSSPASATRSVASARDGSSLVFICRPNNPDGNLIAAADLAAAVAVACRDCVDEAYAEFSGETLLIGCRNTRISSC